MITSAKYINYIVETVNVFRQELISKNKMGLFEGNPHVENFVCQLLNICFDYNLENLNSEKINFPGIDLGDKNKGIGFQVTATKTSEKIKTSLETIVRNNCHTTYPNIRFFITTSKQTSYSINSDAAPNIAFTPEIDILDFDSIFIRSMYLDIDKQKELVDYIHQQIPIVSDSIGVDFFTPNIIKRLEYNFTVNDWNDHELHIEHNFGYTPQVSVTTTNGSLVTARIIRSEKTVTLWAGNAFDGIALLS